MLMLGVGGFFCEWESFDGGWPSIFYVGGGACLLFCPIWYFFVFDSPEEHPRISNRERLYIAQGFEGVTIQKVRIASYRRFSDQCIKTTATILKEYFMHDVTED